MKALTALIGLGLVSAITAQSPLTTLFGVTNGLADGGVVFFNMTVLVPNITVNRMDLNSISAAGTQGRVRVFQTNVGIPQHNGSELFVANWTLLAETSVIAAGDGLVTTACFPTPFTLSSGGQRGYAVEYIGIGPRYTTGTGTNQNYANAEIMLNAGTAQSNGTYAEPPVLGGTVSAPFSAALAGGGGARVFNGSIHYVVGTSAPVCSFNDTFSQGCGGGFASWYNITHTPAEASPKLQGKTVQMGLNANGTYDVTVLPAGALIPYAGHAALSGWATPIVGAIATDDGDVTTAALSGGGFPYPDGLGGLSVAANFVVHTNCMISADGSNIASINAAGGADWAPNVEDLTVNTNAMWSAWHDFDLTPAAAAVRFDDNGLGLYVITYDAVPNIADPLQVSTIQFVFDATTASVSITFATIDPTNLAPTNYSGHPYLVGFSPAGASLKPEFQASMNLFSQHFCKQPEAANMKLTAVSTAVPAVTDGRPVFGKTINYSIANMTGVVPLGLMYFSVGNVGNIPLALLGLGQPGCLLTVDIPNAVGPFSFAAPGPIISIDTSTVVPSMLGLDMWGQALTLDLLAVNILGSIVSSNALHQRIEAN